MFGKSVSCADSESLGLGDGRGGLAASKGSSKILDRKL